MTDAVTRDGFLGGRLVLAQPATGYRAGIDAVLLAAAVPARPGQSALDLGCGAGAAGLCLQARVGGLALAGLELQPAYADLARANARTNELDATIFTGDLTAMPAGLRARSFDHVFANPPYYRGGARNAAADPGRETALAESTPLAAWTDAAIRRLAPGGWLTMIQKADRLPDLLAGLDRRIGTVRVLPIAPRQGRPAELAIVQGRKGGRGGFRLLAPLVLHRGTRHERDGDDHTDAAGSVLRAGAALPLE